MNHFAFDHCRCISYNREHNVILDIKFCTVLNFIYGYAQ